MGKIWDISQVLHKDIPLWPGEPDFTLSRTASISDECPVNIGAMATPLHAGTHADAPFHYSNEGSYSADCDISPYVGRCLVLDVRGAGKTINADDLDWNRIAGHSRLLLRTYAQFPHDQWDSDFKAIGADVIDRLSRQDAVLIGTDTPSLDPQESKTMDAHHAVLAADMRILEGLVLDDVPEGSYELIALPLKIAEADASPVRAILRAEDDG